MGFFRGNLLLMLCVAAESWLHEMTRLVDFGS